MRACSRLQPEPEPSSPPTQVSAQSQVMQMSDPSRGRSVQVISDRQSSGRERRVSSDLFHVVFVKSNVTTESKKQSTA